MSKPKETFGIYGRDGTMPNNNYDDYRSAGIITLERFPSLSPHESELRSLQPQSSPLTHDSSEIQPASSHLSPAEARVKLVEYCLQRASEYLAKNDPMQASEKLYKSMEESIKFLAEFNKLSEADTAEEKGKWSTGLLATSSKKLTKQLSKKEIDEAHAQAWDAHVWGFHENKYGVSEVASVVPYVEKLVQYVKEVNDARRLNP